jgi:hypothetical protein
VGLELEPLGEAAQQRAAAGQQDAAPRQVGGELRRRVLERVPDGVDDLADERLERLARLGAGDLRLARQAAGGVATAHLCGGLALVR